MTDLIRAVNEMVPNLADVHDQMRDQFRHLRGSTSSRAMFGVWIDGADPVEAERRVARLLAAARSAAAKIQAGAPEASLDDEERNGAEAIVSLVGRPPLLVQRGRFAPPPPTWSILEAHRTAIQANLPSVGRVEVPGDGAPRGIGTGFVVGDGVLMTNRHVARRFCAADGEGVWRLNAGSRGQVDFLEEHERTASHDFRVTDVVGVHPRHDLALLRLAPQSTRGRPQPRPLPLATSRGDVAMGREVYVVGYPAFDARNPVEEMYTLFAGIFAVKRLQPGKVLGFLEEEAVLLHDSSTLGGNSGSCVVDLHTHQVIGLHFRGEYLECNHAVALWALRDDKLLRDAGVAFAE